MADQSADIIVIGAGMAGASAACLLAETGSVILLEQESQPGFHSTGRSAAFYTQNYGNSVIRALTRASYDFFVNPPDGFAETPLLSARGALFIAREDQLPQLRSAFAADGAQVPTMRIVQGAELLAINPALRPDYVAAAIYEPDATDIDVNALHRGYLREFARQGGALVTDAQVQAMARESGTWRVSTAAGEFVAPIVINAAGAWCDVVAQLAGAQPVGIQPKRRTIATFAAPEKLGNAVLPLTIDIDEEFYFKSDAGVIMASPADETLVPPCDVQPEELDVAIAIDRVEKAADFQVRRIQNKWAGLRNFVADKSPVVGFDDQADGFFWLAGQGGYGIQTAPAMARLARSLVSDGVVPGDLADLGVAQHHLSPARIR